MTASVDSVPSILMTLAVPDGTGAMAMMCAYATELQSTGHQVTVVHGPVPATQLRPEGRAMSMLAGLRALGIRTIELNRLQATYGLGVARRLARLVADTGSDVVVAFQQVDRKYALTASARCRVPCIVCAGNQHHFWGPLPVRWVKERLYASVLRRRATMVVCTSEVIEREVVERCGVPPDRATVIVNGIRVDSTPDTDPVASRSSVGLTPDDVMAVTVGRIDVQKGQDILVEALARLEGDTRSLRVVVVGDLPDSRNRKRMASYSAELRQRVDDIGWGSRVVFAGWRDDVPHLLAASDFYMQTSRWEGPALPVAALEAMAAGKPVIGTDCSGHPGGFVDGEHGFIVETGSSGDLADAIQRLVLMPPAMRRQMGDAARSLQRERYDLGVLAPQFVALVDRLARVRPQHTRSSPAR